MEEMLLLQAGNFQLGLNLPLIREIHGVSAPSEEQAAEGHRRMQAVDGKEIPLYDLSSILEQKMTSYKSDSKKAIRVETAGRSLLLAVDRIDRVVSVDSVQIKPLPLIFKRLSISCFPHVLKHKDKLILVLNPKGLEQAEQELLTRNHLISKPDPTRALHEDDEIIDLVDEVPYVLINDRILQDKDRNSELIIQKTAYSMPHPVFTQPVERKEMSYSESIPSDIIGNEDDSEDETSLAYMEEKPTIINTAAEIERIVTKMLPEEKLAARVECVVIKMLKEFKVTDKINRIFFQALETPASIAVKAVKEAMRRPKGFLKTENRLQETPAVVSPVADSEQQINVIDKLGRNTGSRLKKIIQEKEMNPTDPDNRQHGVKLSGKAEKPV